MVNTIFWQKYPIYNSEQLQILSEDSIIFRWWFSSWHKNTNRLSKTLNFIPEMEQKLWGIVKIRTKELN